MRRILRRVSIIGLREWDRLRSPGRLAATPDRALVARSAITIDDTGEEIWSVDPDRSIHGASTVKVITGWLALERLELARTVLIRAGDSPLPPSRLRPGDAADVKSLVHLNLIASDGHAAGALARTVGEADLEFEPKSSDVDAALRRFQEIADEKVKALGWSGHALVDPVGANPGNRYTTRQIAELFRWLRDTSPHLHTIASKRSALVHIARRRMRIPMFVTNTYRSATTAIPELIAGKTGWQGGDGYAYLVWTWRHPDGRIFTSAVAETTPTHRAGDARLVIDRSVATGA